MITTTEDRRPQGGIVLLVDVEAMLELSADTLRSHVRAGWLPRPLKLGRIVYWDAQELVDALRRAPRAPKWLGPGDEPIEASPEEDAEAA